MTDQLSFVSANRFNRGLYTSSQSLERVLNAWTLDLTGVSSATCNLSLLSIAIEAHGGLQRWSELRAINATASIRSAMLE